MMNKALAAAQGAAAVVLWLASSVPTAAFVTYVFVKGLKEKRS